MMWEIFFGKEVVYLDFYVINMCMKGYGLEVWILW